MDVRDDEVRSWLQGKVCHGSLLFSSTCRAPCKLVYKSAHGEGTTGAGDGARVGSTCSGYGTETFAVDRVRDMQHTFSSLGCYPGG